MKKVTLLVAAVVLSAFLWSCGSSDSNDEKTKKETLEKKETYDLNTKEGMLLRLSDHYKVTVPSQLSFVEIEKKSGNHKIILKAENITEEELAKLEEWYKNECQRLENDGYIKTVIQDNSKMMGMVFNDFSYRKKTENSTATDWSWNTISVYSVYDIDKKVYELRIKLLE